MREIKMQSRLGNVAFEIEASLRNGREADAAMLAMQQLVFHKAGSKAFGAKAHKREEAFGDGLAADVKAALEDSLGGMFEGIKIATSAYVPSAPDAEKLIASLMKIGVSEKTLAALRSEVKNGAEKPKADEEESVG